MQKTLNVDIVTAAKEKINTKNAKKVHKNINSRKIFAPSLELQCSCIENNYKQMT